MNKATNRLNIFHYFIKFGLFQSMFSNQGRNVLALIVMNTEIVQLNCKESRIIVKNLANFMLVSWLKSLTGKYRFSQDLINQLVNINTSNTGHNFDIFLLNTGHFPVTLLDKD